MPPNLFRFEEIQVEVIIVVLASALGLFVSFKLLVWIVGILEFFFQVG